ncbi:hypothetical protein PR048_005421, partial [Dryococelus australis]
MLFYDHVRWLSKGQTLRRVSGLREEIVLFLELMDTSEKNSFLVDILSYLNNLNLCLQGKYKIMCELSEFVLSFKTKIELFIQDSLS